MPATTTVIYPAGHSFDMKYYLDTHMPLVQEQWEPLGLKSWKVIQFDDPQSPYIVQATLEWDSVEDFQKASTSDAAKIVLDDVTNFTESKLIIMTGNVLATSS